MYLKRRRPQEIAGTWGIVWLPACAMHLLQTEDASPAQDPVHQRVYFNCAYCQNNCNSDVPRASFTPDEICTLTMEFYRRNYIEVCS